MTETDRWPGNEAAIAAEAVAGLNDLLKLDHDAVGSYEVAIEHLQDPDHALQIEGFKQEHERHIRGLNELIVKLGGSPTNEPHATAPLKQGLQRLGAAAGDRTLLLAWRANEFQVLSKYESYARRSHGWPAEARALIDEFALDEERHYQWAVDLLGGPAPEMEISTRLREGITQARVATEEAQDRIATAARGARTRAASGLEGAAVRLDRLAAGDGSDGARARVGEGARRLARGLDSTAHYLREGDEGQLRTMAEDQIRANPARSLLGIFVVGFVTGRILR